MKLKDNGSVHTAGVKRVLWYAIGVADCVCQEIAGTEMIITSLNDGQHMKGSKHYEGLAFDLRTRTMTTPVRQDVVTQLINRLKSHGFDVVVETDHIHVEYDPKSADVTFIQTGERW